MQTTYKKVQSEKVAARFAPGDSSQFKQAACIKKTNRIQRTEKEIRSFEKFLKESDIQNPI